MLGEVLGDVYRIDSASPSELNRGGCIRLVLHAAFAAQVMHYEARAKANETKSVSVILRRAVGIRLASGASASSSSSSSSRCPRVHVLAGASTHKALCAYGAKVRKQFDEENPHLTIRASQEGLERVMGVVRTALVAQSETPKEVTELREVVVGQNKLIEQPAASATGAAGKC